MPIGRGGDIDSLEEFEGDGYGLAVAELDPVVLDGVAVDLPASDSSDGWVLGG